MSGICFAEMEGTEDTSPGHEPVAITTGRGNALTAIVIHCNVHTVKPAFRTLIIRIRRIRAWQ